MKALLLAVAALLVSATAYAQTPAMRYVMTADAAPGTVTTVYSQVCEGRIVDVQCVADGAQDGTVLVANGERSVASCLVQTDHRVQVNLTMWCQR